MKMKMGMPHWKISTLANEARVRFPKNSPTWSVVSIRLPGRPDELVFIDATGVVTLWNERTQDSTEVGQV